MQKLSAAELETMTRNLSGWKVEDGRLVRDWKFADFVTAMAFVNKVAEAAEKAQHHPDIDIRYNRVRLGLVTHDAGGITAKDVKMARSLDRVASGG
jgi:4a-hydroxytetrahydrobiopterin dehydratase